MRSYLQHGSRHVPGTGSDPIPGLVHDQWCMANASGTVPGDNTVTNFNLQLAFGSGVDSGLYTADTGGSFDTVQINEAGTFAIQWTAHWLGSIASPAEGQELLANAFNVTGISTANFGFGGLPVDGEERLRSTGSDYSNRLSSGGFLHWPTNGDTPPTFLTSNIGAHANQNTGSSLTLVFWAFIRRVDLYMLSSANAVSWSP